MREKIKSKKYYMRKSILKNCLISMMLYFAFIQFIYGQDTIPEYYDPTGIIWVVPKRADAFPINGIQTGNSGLNFGLESYHVIEYNFLDSLYFTSELDTNGFVKKKAVYQIRLQEEYAHWEVSLLDLLHYCYPGFFEDFAFPYYNPHSDGQTITTDNGRIILEFEGYYFNSTLLPRSNTRSNNKPMNLILKKYDIKSYTYHAFPPFSAEDTNYRWIDIVCGYQDALALYYDLLNINYLYDYISIARSKNFGENNNPCGPFSSLSDEKEPPLSIFPNPAQDEITISGVTPESIMIYDVMGKLVVSEFDPVTNKVDIKKLPNGLYIIKIKTVDGKIFTDKILKQ